VDLQAKVRLKTNDLSSFVERQLTRLEKKIANLNNDLNDALNSDKDKLYGELLLSYSKLKEKHDKVTVLNYYTNENVTIKLDPKLDVIGNSSKYYKKYQKSKNAIIHLKEQIEITENEIEYFKVLKYQIANASINEALEIQDELIENKYLLKKQSKNNNRKQKTKLLTYELENSTLISVGKNNLQNEYLTHKLATGNEMWFHIQHGAGSHVVVHNTKELSEEEIRTGAILAAYYSTYSESSSVAVDYTRIRNIKKIPGKRNCFVTYTNQKTIYIDPDINIIKSLKEKK
jgi:predicted ribosome quality control (RQC) complex YloA/Tae2 family protein